VPPIGPGRALGGHGGYTRASMLAGLKHSLAQELARVIRARFDVDHQPSIETPPRRELGDLAFPAPLHLARALKKNPRAIAEELQEHWKPGAPVREVRIEGAGYLNVAFDRAALAAAWLDEPVIPDVDPRPGKTIVEHTNINPNKAAHIGHVRNAVLGDTLVRVLRALGHTVEVQNYIDDTGVQLADVVVGFMDLRHLSVAEVAALPEPFDYRCWDLYAEVGRWYAGGEGGAGGARGEKRRETLHALESGQGERAEMGRLVAERVVGRHLGTMARLGVDYDLLTHESHILGLHFFDVAFERLKASGAIRLEGDGKNAGCWVMPLSQSAEFQGMSDPDKVIVRSDGTVTYVGKDIAYQLWKFGLLGRDFAYRYRMDRSLWTTALEGAERPPSFGRGDQVINVIDARQSYPQKVVRAGLEALGHDAEARRSIHFAYEMVSLSQAAARVLGVTDDVPEVEDDGAPDDEADAPAHQPAAAAPKKTLEMSGRKGIGVKADDLIDQVIAKAKREILERDRDLEGGAVETLARDIAVAALRFFMVKQTTTRVIAFDFDEALAFEGETGPYLQYSAVRARNILKKMEAAGLRSRVVPAELAALPADVWGDDLWDLILGVAQSAETLEKAGSSLELSLLARHTLDLAQKFNAIYHKHPLVQEADAPLRTARLTAILIFLKGLEALSGTLGVPLPLRM
jgi:arginyl-tRNA synthetase